MIAINEGLNEVSAIGSWNPGSCVNTLIVRLEEHTICTSIAGTKNEGKREKKDQREGEREGMLHIRTVLH